ncbi:hypothetical protein BD410DRAFT_803709 [Rickenella mellea]|uniref:Uncharacterized protein n=1 Tax=Rickenella mellea TaxID=50990 RepID=A0A4Y7Q4H1_9AGAM|nr:hypothetical protein BD410DRAFT_803709 [Rickenella mellea]
MNDNTKQRPRQSSMRPPQQTLITPSASPPVLRTVVSYGGHQDGSPTKKRRLSQTPSLVVSRSRSDIESTPSSSSSLPSEDPEDLRVARRANSYKVLNYWSQLAEKYSKRLDEDDIVDFRSEEIVKDRGVLRRASGIHEFGCLYEAEEQVDQDDDSCTPTDTDDVDELDAFADKRTPAEDTEIDLHPHARPLPPVRPLDPEDAEDLREFLEAERRRQELYGDVEDDESTEHSMERDSESEDEGAYEEEVEEFVEDADDRSVRSKSFDPDDPLPEILFDEEGQSTSVSHRSPPPEQVLAQSDDESDDELGGYDVDEGPTTYLVDGDPECSETETESFKKDSVDSSPTTPIPPTRCSRDTSQSVTPTKQIAGSPDSDHIASRTRAKTPIPSPIMLTFRKAKKSPTTSSKAPKISPLRSISPSHTVSSTPDEPKLSDNKYLQLQTPPRSSSASSNSSSRASVPFIDLNNPSPRAKSSAKVHSSRSAKEFTAKPILKLDAAGTLSRSAVTKSEQSRMSVVPEVVIERPSFKTQEEIRRNSVALRGASISLRNNASSSKTERVKNEKSDRHGSQRVNAKRIVNTPPKSVKSVHLPPSSPIIVEDSEEERTEKRAGKKRKQRSPSFEIPAYNYEADYPAPEYTSPSPSGSRSVGPESSKRLQSRDAPKESRPKHSSSHSRAMSQLSAHPGDPQGSYSHPHPYSYPSTSMRADPHHSYGAPDLNAHHYIWAQAMHSLSVLMSANPQNYPPTPNVPPPGSIPWPPQNSIGMGYSPWTPHTPQHRMHSSHSFPTPGSRAAPPPSSSPLPSRPSTSSPSPSWSSPRSVPRGRSRSLVQEPFSDPPRMPRSAIRGRSVGSRSQSRSRRVSFSTPEAVDVDSSREYIPRRLSVGDGRSESGTPLDEVNDDSAREGGRSHRQHLPSVVRKGKSTYSSPDIESLSDGYARLNQHLRAQTPGPPNGRRAEKRSQNR